MASARTNVTFMSDGDRVAAWSYPSADGAIDPAPCVVMAHGFSLTRHDGLADYAERFAAAGLRVLVFDHRYLGDSAGEPRQRFRIRAQLDDWRHAISHARGMQGVDPERIVLWGYSFSGGYVTTLAARDSRLAAALVLCPFVNGLARVLATKPALSAWILPRAFADLAGRPELIPVTGPPGAHGAMTLPGEAEGFERTVAPGSPWRNEISPGVFATVAFHRPLVYAKRIGCPLWVGLGERDRTVEAKSVERLAARAQNGELHRYPVDHFGPFEGDAPERIAADQIEFLGRCGLTLRQRTVIRGTEVSRRAERGSWGHDELRHPSCPPGPSRLQPGGLGRDPRGRRRGARAARTARVGWPRVCGAARDDLLHRGRQRHHRQASGRIPGRQQRPGGLCVAIGAISQPITIITTNHSYHDQSRPYNMSPTRRRPWAGPQALVPSCRSCGCKSCNGSKRR